MSETFTQPAVALQIYPEREEPRLEWLDRFLASASGILAPWIRPRASRFNWIISEAAMHAREMENWSDTKMLEKSMDLRQSLRRRGFEKSLISRAFALIREVARRKLDMPHFDVQLIGGLVLLNGMVAEMETGEGKTLTATLPACTAAFAGIPVHIITVNDYLAKRDAEWMGPVYKALGLTVGTIQHGLDFEARRAAYRCDITYCTNKEAAFDYLRDRILLWERPSQTKLLLERMYSRDSRVHQLIMRGLHFAIVDEADSVLIDEARTPLIISSDSNTLDEQATYQRVIDFANQLISGKDFQILAHERTVELTDKGKARIRDHAWPVSGVLTNARHREEMIRQAIVALHLFSLDKNYLVRDGKVQIIDEFTGRLMPDRSWERGLHQLIEIKENCDITSLKETKARISYQRFFRRYLRIAGMTGTAREVAGELWSIYHMRVVTIPTNRPMRRQYLPDRIYPSAEKKWKVITEKIRDLNQRGRPVLIGTRSVSVSEHLSNLLKDASLSHRVLNARQDKEEAEIIAQAGRRGQITVATNMAGRGTDIRLAPEVPALGGLHVIATERHEARRIDRQLFGRSGRQGDPGSYEAIVSLEDELITVYLNNPFRWLANKVLKGKGNPCTQWIGRVLFRMAQFSAECLHARMRRDLLMLDDQLGDSLAFSGRQE